MVLPQLNDFIFLEKTKIFFYENQQHWLELLKESEFIEYDFESLIQQNQELAKILTSIIKTSQENS